MATAQRPRGESAPKRLSPEILDRTPPRSQESERNVLGSILLLPEVCDDVALILRPDDFYDPAHHVLYSQMLAMRDEGQQLDHTLLIERLRSAGEFERVGGLAFIAEVASSVPTAAHAQYYARIVRDKAMARSLIHASTDILRDAYDETVDAQHMVGRAEEKIFAILDQKGAGEVTTIRQVLHDSLVRIDARMKNEHALGGLSTGFTAFDDMTGGLHDSELVILAARPSMGKTALAMNIAEHAALVDKQATLFVSLEMSAMELGDRLLCSMAKVNSSKLRNGTISNDDRAKLVRKAADVSMSPLFIDDSPNRTMSEIAANARRLKRKENLRLVVIDYLQLIEPDNEKDPRQEQVAKVARRLKGLARELKLPVLCLSQLNRQAEEGKEHRPRLSHLRESGAIEQDADVVMFVHREEYFATNEEDRQQLAGDADLIVAKQRNGPTGDVKLVWLRDFTRFENAASRAYNDFEPPGGDFR